MSKSKTQVILYFPHALVFCFCFIIFQGLDILWGYLVAVFRLYAHSALLQGDAWRLQGSLQKCLCVCMLWPLLSYWSCALLRLLDGAALQALALLRFCASVRARASSIYLADQIAHSDLQESLVSRSRGHLWPRSATQVRTGPFGPLGPRVHGGLVSRHTSRKALCYKIWAVQEWAPRFLAVTHPR